MRLVDLIDQLLERMAADTDSASRSTARPRPSTTTSRSAPRPSRSSGGSSPRAAWRSGRGRSCSTSSSCRARRSSGTSRSGWHVPRRSARAMRVGYLPGHVRAHRPDAPDPAPRRDRPSRRLARRPRGDRPARVHVALTRRVDRRDRVPGRRLRQRRVPVRRPGPARRQARRVPPAPTRSFYGDRSLLAMYGTDHAVPSPTWPTSSSA